MRVRVAILLGVLLFAGIVLVAIESGHEVQVADGPQTPPADARPTLRGMDHPDVAAPNGAPSEAVPETPNAPGATPPPATRSVRIHGTLHQAKLDGTAVPVVRGTLVVYYSSADAEGEQTVEVLDGNWSVEIPAGDHASVRGITIDGKLAVPLFETSTSIGPERYTEPLAVRAEVVRPTILHVVDAETGADLDGVTVVRSDGSETWFPHPGDRVREGTVIESRASPCELPIWDPELVLREEVLWASAPGYAWSKLCFDMVAGGERRLALHPGGAIHVRFGGDAAPEDAWLRIRRDPVAPDTEEEAAFRIWKRNSIDVERLTEGRYIASVELDGWRTEPRQLAVSPFRIEAGSQTKLFLRLAALEQPKPVLVRGTVVIPRAWGIEKPRLRIELQGEAVSEDEWLLWLDPGEQFHPVAEGSETWRFDLGRLPPSRAVIHVEGTGIRSVAEIGATDPIDLELHVPPPAKVSVRVLNVRTGRGAEVEHLWWHIAAPDGDWTGIQARRNDDTGVFEFLAPVGARADITVDVVSALDYDGTVDVAPRGVVKTITIDPAGSVLVVLMDGDARLPHHAHAELLKGEEDMAIAWGDHDEGCVVHAREAGRLRLRLPDFEGFEPIPDREVVIQPGLQTRVTIPLVRSP